LKRVWTDRPSKTDSSDTDQNGSGAVRENGWWATHRQTQTITRDTRTASTARRDTGQTDKMQTEWIVVELWELNGREMKTAYTTKSGAENWMRIAQSGIRQPVKIYIEERQVAVNSDSVERRIAEGRCEECGKDYHVSGDGCILGHNTACDKCNKEFDDHDGTDDDEHGFICPECAGHAETEEEHYYDVNEDMENIIVDGEELWLGVKSGFIFRATENGDIKIGVAGQGEFKNVKIPPSPSNAPSTY